jgi:hypothetical protein
MNWATVQRQRGGSSLADDGGVNTEFWENTRCLKINDEKRFTIEFAQSGPAALQRISDAAVTPEALAK